MGDPLQPDDQDRCNLLSFRDGSMVSLFAPLPGDRGRSVVDRRDEIHAFGAGRSWTSLAIMDNPVRSIASNRD